MTFLISAFKASSMTFFSRIVCRMPGWAFSTNWYSSASKRRTFSTGNIVEEAVGTGEDDQNLLLHRQRLILTLFQNLDQTASAIQLLLRGLVEIGTKLRKGGQFAILRQFETKRTGNRSHGFRLRAAADAADRETDVNRRPNVRVEQVGFEIDLAVGDRNHVGRNVRRNVACLRFDKRQRGQRTAAFRAFSFAARSSRRL